MEKEKEDGGGGVGWGVGVGDWWLLSLEGEYNSGKTQEQMLK